MTESNNESGDSRKLPATDQATETNRSHHEQTLVDTDAINGTKPTESGFDNTDSVDSTNRIDSTDIDQEQAVPPYKREPVKSDKSAGIKKAILVLLVLLILGAIAYGLYKSNQHNAPEVITLQGQMQMQQTSIAAKVPGRIAQIMVTEGDAVTVGQQLIEMDSPEINAKINQARAGKQMAQSQLDKAENGARPQEIAQAKAAWQANKAASDLAENTYQRVNRLYEEGLMARQKRDEAYAQYLV